MENNSIGGKWNILGEKYDGELVFNEKNGLILISLYYNNPSPITWAGKPLVFPEVTGTINQEIHCILSNCEVIKRNCHNFTRHNVLIRAKSIFFGTNIEKQQSLKFNKIEFRLTNIFPWTGMNGFKPIFDNPEYHFMLVINLQIRKVLTLIRKQK